MKDLLKIAVVGPESTGKSTMATSLAKTYQTNYVPEYSRYYCQDLKKEYTLQDETNMFFGQIALEDAITSVTGHNLLICDTTILTVKIWSDHLFHKTDDVVLKEISIRKYNLYLLMDIDLPWEDDPLRDFPEQRDYFMEVWKKELTALGAHYRIISGIGDFRLKNGLAAVDDFMSKNH